ncbi:hypothetical protein [Agrococcus sp. HG114]|uniref:hypothetical protein n=1 Tax=Agrococcus sp. HG114 TaxID=2969757 RepID=UPI00215A9699|nr:hypothetical protein [Agrococcus sp. HG114]MCR8671489.1 hypothetical protein [Agrococcus sp. HG114]
MFESSRVLCTMQYRLPLDGGADAVGAFAVAYVRDTAVRAQVEAWAEQQGLVPQQTEDAALYFTATGDDGVIVLVEQAGPRLDEHARITGLDLEPADLVVTHRSVEPRS